MQICTKWLILLETILTNIFKNFKNILMKLSAGEPNQIVKITVP